MAPDIFPDAIKHPSFQKEENYYLIRLYIYLNIYESNYRALYYVK